MNFTKMPVGALATAIALFLGFSARAQHPFTIQGQLNKDRQGKVVLIYKVHGVSKADSAQVTDGAFIIKGEVSDPVYSILEFNRPIKITQENAGSYDAQEFFLDGGTYTITGGEKIAAAKIIGGQAQADFKALRLQYAPIDEKLKDLKNQLSTSKAEMNDTAVLRIQKENGILMQQVKAIDSTFIATHLDSYTAFDLWRKKHRGVVNADLEPSFKRFSKRIQSTEEGAAMSKRIEEAKRLSPGKLAPDFTLKDTLGNDVSLSSLRGKNVLICFWISDFGTFSDFAFSMNKIHRRLRDKNFTVLSIFFDNGKKESKDEAYWKKILSDFSLNNWINLQDIGGMEMNGGPVSTTAKAYAIGPRSLPLLYLIGPDGKILARNLLWYDKDVSKTIENLLK